jgi:hypothetical protein
MKKYQIIFMACVLAVSCNTSSGDGVLEDEDRYPIQNDFPHYCVDHPSELSDTMKVLINDDKGFVKEGKPLKADQMRIDWAFNFNTEIPRTTEWMETGYDYLIEALEKMVEEEAPICNTDILTYPVYAGIDTLTLTADKTLFGREPGADLSDKFEIMDFRGSAVLLSYPDAQVICGYDDDKVMTVAEWVEKGGMLYEFRARYLELPSEVYDEVTFTMIVKATDDKTLIGTAKVIFEI